MAGSKLMNTGKLLSSNARPKRSALTSAVVEILEERRLFTTYYDNGSLTVAGSGTAASPWDSLYSIQIFSGFHPGDVVLMSGTFKNQTLIMGNSTTGITLTSQDANNPATISEAATFNFSNAVQISAAGVTLSYLNLTGPGITADNNSYYGIVFENTGTIQFTGATVDHVNESGFVFAGLMIEGTNTAGFTNASVTNSTFSDNQVSGIVVKGSKTGYLNDNVLISNCVTSGNAGAAVYYNANNNSANENAINGGIFLSSVNGGVVTHCTALGNCYNSEGACGIWAFNSNDLNFEYSESGDNATLYAGYDGNGFDFDNDVSNSIMQYDYSHGNDGIGLYICSFDGVGNNNDDTIRYCISDDDALKSNYAVLLYNSPTAYVTNAEIYDNTILTEGGHGEAVSIGGNSTGVNDCTANFVNNIIYTDDAAAALDCDTFSPSLSNVKFEGNDFYTTGYTTTFKVYWGGVHYTSLSAWSSATGEENIGGSIVGLNVDPLLVNEAVVDEPIANVGDFALTASSPLRGMAVNLSASPFNTSTYTANAPYNIGGTAWGGIGTQDYFGNSIATGTINTGADQSSTMTINGTSSAQTFTFKADATLPHTLDYGGSTYRGIQSVIFNGSTGNDTIIVDLSNGPIGLTFNAGSGSNSLTTQNAVKGEIILPINFKPAGLSNSLNISAGNVSVPAGTQTGIRTATFSTINIAAGSTVSFASPGTNQSNRTLVLIKTGLTLSGSTNAWTSKLDLGGNDMDVTGGNLATLTNQIQEQWLSGWQGSGGITSTLVAADTTHLTALGAIRDTADGTPTGAVLYGTFDSLTGRTAADILIKYTYSGDANIGGSVDGSDYTRIDNGFVSHLTGWYNGDFNYDGVINGSDYTLIDNAFNTQGAALTAQIASPSDFATDAATVFSSNAIVADDLTSFWMQKKTKAGRSTLLQSVGLD